MACLQYCTSAFIIDSFKSCFNIWIWYNITCISFFITLSMLSSDLLMRFCVAMVACNMDDSNVDALKMLIICDETSYWLVGENLLDITESSVWIDDSINFQNCRIFFYETLSVKWLYILINKLYYLCTLLICWKCRCSWIN